MKKKNIPVEFVFQLFALIIAIIIVHAFYQTVVRPNAAQIIEEQNIAAAPSVSGRWQSWDSKPSRFSASVACLTSISYR
jgi:uncharacterized membrane protein YjfL (UPF0719 family)